MEDVAVACVVLFLMNHNKSFFFLFCFVRVFISFWLLHVFLYEGAIKESVLGNTCMWFNLP